MNKGFLFLLFFLTLSACHKEMVQQVELKRISLPIVRDLMSLRFRDSLHGVVTGGKLWKEGVIFSTSDGGENWRVDTLLRNRIECVRFNANGDGFACGVDGQALFMEPAEWGRWSLFRQDWYWSKACAFPKKNYGVIVGGEGWKQGEARAFGPDAAWSQRAKWLYPAELNDVCFVDSTTVVAVGMGWVMRSPDAGQNWERLTLEGDFFTSVHFPDTQTGYLCGYQGSIYKSGDSGLNWQQIRKGGTSAKRNKGFKALFFRSTQEGWIAGKNGLLWHTTDGGEHWITVEGVPASTDLNTVFANETGVWTAGTDGLLYHY